MSRGALALAAGLLAVAGAVQGREHVALAGTEWSGHGSYTYVGVISPLGSASLGRGFVLRNWLERLTYEYDAATTGIDAERYGYAPALGYQGSLAGGYAGIYGGVRFAHTDLSPEDPGNDETGRTNRWFLQADATTPFGARVENQLVTSFETRYSDYYVRERLLVRLNERYTLGPEVVVKGGRDYDGWQAGLALGGIRIGPGLGVVLRGGISTQDGEPNSGYASVELAMSLGR